MVEEVDFSGLPPELRMDEYDDDEILGEDDDDNDEYAVRLITLVCYVVAAFSIIFIVHVNLDA